MKKAIAIVDLQFGSTGKGALAGALAHIANPDTCAHANHPNAGHTFVKDGRKYVFTMTANSFVAPSVKTMLIGPGAVVDVPRLVSELLLNKDMFEGKTVVIHPNAAMLRQEHADAEKTLVSIGSTMKGSAEAVIAKMRRSGQGIIGRGVMGQTPEVTAEYITTTTGIKTLIRYGAYKQAIENSKMMIVEGAQGHSLSVHGRFYPFCTSRDVSVNQLMADCGLPRSDKFELLVGGCIRTYPIRVANRFDADGVQIGSSGPYYPDQQELNWKDDLGREPELTTVTKLPRRVFSFSHDQLGEACQINRPDFVFMSFCDYLAPDPGTPNVLPLPVTMLRESVQTIAGVPVRLVSYGPGMEQMYAAIAGHQYQLTMDSFTSQEW